MLFDYVDRIFQLEPGKFATGLKNVTRNESFFYWLPTGERVLSPAVVTEGLAQLGAWLKMASADFTKRPVLLADEKTEYFGWAKAGDQIDLKVKILSIDDDVVVSRSEARVEGKLIQRTECCRGYLLPIEEFSDRDEVLRQFKNLHRPELEAARDKLRIKEYLHPEAGARIWDRLMFVDGIVEHDVYRSVRAFKNFSACEPYFATHFPRKPVVPGVLLLTFIGEVCQYLVKPRLDFPIRARALIPTFVRNARFRKFVEPGDQCVLQADIIDGCSDQDNQEVVVKTTVHANSKRVMQAEMGFVTMFGPQSRALERYGNSED